ncbi:spore maturation protein A [Marvinbryantia formatexigens]|nr:spore maturation protein A [Marvinbryantia formatexigens]
MFFSPNLTPANVLGLGWAATPAGLKAMEELEKLEEERRRDAAGKTEADIIHNGWEKKSADMAQSSVVQSGVAQGSAAHKKNGRCRWERGGMPPGVASNEMCTFLILNISSLQLIPVNIIAYRAQYGSVNPTAIVGPGILATAVSTAVAVVFCKMMDKKRRV